MGNTASTTSTTTRRSHRRRLRSQQSSAPPSNPPPPAYYNLYHGYYPPPAVAPHDRVPAEAENGYPSGPVVHKPAPYVEHEKAVTIRNDVNLKRETLRMEPDEGNPTKYLVAFTFDATVACSITIIFFAKEEEDCKLSPTKENLFAPVTVHFQQGLGQKFKQPSGTGIDFSLCEETELLKADVVDLYPLAVKAEASPSGSMDRNGECGATNSQITRAVFEKEKGEYGVRVVKQFLWVNGNRYELQEIYGIGNSADCDADSDGNEIGKECVICLSEPQDTTVLPCRHMCMCSGCAKVLRFKTDRCPICRQPVERLLEIKVNSNGSQDN